jgi:radical SAM-linked protein
MQDGFEKTGWREIGLLSLSTADYSALDTLLSSARDLKEAFHVNVSLPSTRISSLDGRQLEAARRISSSGSFTIAPEAGSQRLRNVINKDFTEDAIVETARLLLDNNVQTLKLYFMIGLPTETDEDIELLIECVRRIASIAWKMSRRRTVHVSVSPFSPKPHTPFQWEAMEARGVLTQKNSRIMNGLKACRNVKISYRDPNMTFLETVMARGDRSLSACIVSAWKRGARFDGWNEQFSMQHWRGAAHDNGIDMEMYAQEIAETQPLPWQACSLGIRTPFLVEERRASREARLTPDCRTEPCASCGACSLASRVFAEKSVRAGQIKAIGSISRDTRPERQADNRRHFYRVTYCKGSDIRFLSHRDMVEVLHRALRAARLPLAYSQGYHPLPRISFGPPLALGILGDKELFDVQLIRPSQPRAEKINRWLPNGLRIENVRKVDGKPESLNATITAGHYVIVPHGAMQRNEVRGAVEHIRNSKQLIIDIERKGTHGKKDLRPLIYKVQYYTHDGVVCIDAVLSMLAGKTCRPSELLHTMFPAKRFSDFFVRRIECLRCRDNRFVPML